MFNMGDDRAERMLDMICSQSAGYDGGNARENGECSQVQHDTTSDLSLSIMQLPSVLTHKNCFQRKRCKDVETQQPISTSVRIGR